MLSTSSKLLPLLLSSSSPFTPFRATPLWKSPSSPSSILRILYCTTTTNEETTPPSPPPLTPTQPPPLTLTYFRGLPQFTIPLPSRQERCRFILKPLTNTIGDLAEMIKKEDKGVDRVVLRDAKDGTRLSSTTTIETLMEHSSFDLILNEQSFRVTSPEQEQIPKGSAGGVMTLMREDPTLSTLRTLITQLHATLNPTEHSLRAQRQLQLRLETLKSELVPLETKRAALATLAQKRTNSLTWLGLGLMSVQFGILARLTWWEYSWDIMEPVTYFVTYGTAMLAYAYFVLTRQEYVLPQVAERAWLGVLWRGAKKVNLDLEKYNKLKDEIWRIEGELERMKGKDREVIGGGGYEEEDREVLLSVGDEVDQKAGRGMLRAKGGLSGVLGSLLKVFQEGGGGGGGKGGSGGNRG